jgi:hypothetical protein
MGFTIKNKSTHDADCPLSSLLHDLLAVLHGPGLVLRQRWYGGRVTLASVTTSMTSIPPLPQNKARTMKDSKEIMKKRRERAICIVSTFVLYCKAHVSNQMYPLFLTKE